MSEPKMIPADSEAVRVAGLVLAAELGHTVVGWGDRPAPAPNTQRITLAVLAAAYPHLRRQIETEVRGQVAGEIEQMESAWYFGGPHAPGVRVVSQEGALQAARGAAQPGGRDE